MWETRINNSTTNKEVYDLFRENNLKSKLTLRKQNLLSNLMSKRNTLSSSSLIQNRELSSPPSITNYDESQIIPLLATATSSNNEPETLNILKHLYHTFVKDQNYVNNIMHFIKLNASINTKPLAFSLFSSILLSSTNPEIIFYIGEIIVVWTNFSKEMISELNNPTFVNLLLIKVQNNYENDTHLIYNTIVMITNVILEVDDVVNILHKTNFIKCLFSWIISTDRTWNPVYMINIFIWSLHNILYKDTAKHNEILIWNEDFLNSISGILPAWIRYIQIITDDDIIDNSMINERLSVLLQVIFRWTLNDTLTLKWIENNLISKLIDLFEFLFVNLEETNNILIWSSPNVGNTLNIFANIFTLSNTVINQYYSMEITLILGQLIKRYKIYNTNTAYIQGYLLDVLCNISAVPNNNNICAWLETDKILRILFKCFLGNIECVGKMMIMCWNVWHEQSENLVNLIFFAEFGFWDVFDKMWEAFNWKVDGNAEVEAFNQGVLCLREAVEYKRRNKNVYGERLVYEIIRRGYKDKINGILVNSSNKGKWDEEAIVIFLKEIEKEN